MHIADLLPPAFPAAAEILVLAFREHWPTAWPTLPDAMEEMQELVTPPFFVRGAFAADGALMGFIGGRPEYDGNVWELHPLAVHPRFQQQGVGRALVHDFEVQVQQRGGLTIVLGSDDENGMTSLAGADLYTDLWAQIARIRNLKRHPYEFYQKMGFTITGVVPDANGRGKPDILMAKRVGPPPP